MRLPPGFKGLVIPGVTKSGAEPEERCDPNGRSRPGSRSKTSGREIGAPSVGRWPAARNAPVRTIPRAADWSFRSGRRSVRPAPPCRYPLTDRKRMLVRIRWASARTARARRRASDRSGSSGSSSSFSPAWVRQTRLRAGRSDPGRGPGSRRRRASPASAAGESPVTSDMSSAVPPNRPLHRGRVRSPPGQAGAMPAASLASQFHSPARSVACDQTTPVATSPSLPVWANPRAGHPAGCLL